jgi:alpha-galactosidase
MPIQYIEDNIWMLHTAHTTYALGAGGENRVINMYWGPRLPYEEDLPLFGMIQHASFTNDRNLEPNEYPTWGGMNYCEVCLKATVAAGVRDIQDEFESYHVGVVSVRGKQIPELIVTMADSKYPLKIHLHYRVFEDQDVIERFAVIENLGETAVELQQVCSAAWYVPDMPFQPYRLSYLTGRWYGEYNLTQIPVMQGKHVLESRYGFTSHYVNPWFALDHSDASETHGEVWFGGLHWSGNWKIAVEQNELHQIRVVGGLNDFDFSWILEPKATFETPVFSAGFTEQGFGEASRILHRYQQDRVLPAEHAHALRKVLYNSWEATFFDVKEAEQALLAEKAAAIGVELFVIDDGWFGKRNTDRAGLGDWVVNENKFPNGLGALVQKVNSLGMDFGIWVEPEMVNPDSELYRTHPDWAIQFPTRTPTQARNQLNLNLAMPEVKEYIFNCVDQLLSQYNIKFMKWDCNKSISDPGWASQPPPKQQHIWVEYTRNLYEIFDRLKQRHPQVVFETCSGGGGRVDMGILQRTDQAWTSDNTNPYDRLFIQEGFSHAYTPKVMVSWVTDTAKEREFSLDYRFHSAMMGTLGIGANLNHYSEKQLKKAQKHIAEYKEIRHLVQEGDMYRLLSPRTSNLSAVQYVAQDKSEAVVFVFLHSSRYNWNNYRLRLQGLDPKTVYSAKGHLPNVSGQALMSSGLRLQWNGDFKSACIRITREK